MRNNKKTCVFRFRWKFHFVELSSKNIFNQTSLKLSKSYQRGIPIFPLFTLKLSYKLRCKKKKTTRHGANILTWRLTQGFKSFENTCLHIPILLHIALVRRKNNETTTAPQKRKQCEYFSSWNKSRFYFSGRTTRYFRKSCKTKASKAPKDNTVKQSLYMMGRKGEIYAR